MTLCKGFTLTEGTAHTARNDMNTFPRPQGRGIKGEGLLHRPDCKILKRVQDDRVLSEAHRKELNVLTSYRLNDFKKKAGATHVDMSANIRRAAFTLAEVLITLGIIGVVAAMTIPTLIANYQKKITTTRLKHAYSLVTQASKMWEVDYSSDERYGDCFPANDPDAALEKFEKYYVPYIKFAKVEKGNYGVFGYLQNGSVLYFHRDSAINCSTGWWSDTYIYVCTTANACKFDEKNSGQVANGKDRFLFYTDGQVPHSTLQKYSNGTYTRDDIVSQCENNTGGEACTVLLFIDGWQIKEDYPWL